jgi:hypothetical protein
MEESAIRIITICIANVMYVSEQNDKAQAGHQQKPVHNGNVYLSHKFSRCVNNFEPRKTTKCYRLF